MKKLIKTPLFLILLLCGISSCSNAYDPSEDGNHRSRRVKEKQMVKTVRMSFGGDFVEESEEPLLRADDGDTYAAINVFRSEIQDGGLIEDEERYAYGVFKGKDDIQVDLITGYTYRFEATILIDDIDKVQLLDDKCYLEPFRYADKRSVNFEVDTQFKKEDIDKFHYTYLNEDDNSRIFLCQLNSGTAFVNVNGDWGLTAKTMQYPRINRFYGQLNNLNPEKINFSENEKIEIPMEYKSFGLKFLLESIPENTSVSVEDITSYGNKNPENDKDYYLLFPKDLNLNFNSGESSWEGIFSLNDLTSSSKQFTIRFCWDKGSGSKEYFTHTFTANAKIKKILKINIEGTVDETKSGNIDFINIDQSMTEDTESVSNKN